MKMLNWFKRIFSSKQPSNNTNMMVTESVPMFEYSKMLDDFLEKNERKCCNKNNTTFNEDAFVSTILSDKEHTIDFFKKYFYAGNDQDKIDFKNLLDFRCCTSDVLEYQNEKWKCVNNFIEKIVSDSKFKDMQLGNKIVEILLTKDWKHQGQKIEKIHSLNSLCLMVKNEIFDVQDLKKILVALSEACYNADDERKIRNNLLVNILEKYEIEDEVYNIVLNAVSTSSTFYTRSLGVINKHYRFCGLWEQLQSVKMIPQNLVAQAILCGCGPYDEFFLKVEDVKNHYPNALHDLCVKTKSGSSVPFYVCEDYLCVKRFIEKYISAFSEEERLLVIEKIVFNNDGKEALAFDILNNTDNKNSLSISQAAKIQLSEYVLIQKQNCLKDGFWRGIIQDVAVELRNSNNFSIFPENSRNLVENYCAINVKNNLTNMLKSEGIDDKKSEGSKRKM